MESVRSSRRHGKQGGRQVCVWNPTQLCGLCLIGKIVQEHCTTILIAIRFRKFVYGLGSARSVLVFLRL